MEVPVSNVLLLEEDETVEVPNESDIDFDEVLTEAELLLTKGEKGPAAFSKAIATQLQKVGAWLHQHANERG